MHLEERGIKLRLDEPSDVLLIAFGGLGRMPYFEFSKVVRQLDPPVKTALVRDLEQAWYHRGVVGIGDTVEAVAEYLRGLIRDVGARRVVTIGNSAGGYAAILFGHLIGAAEALAVRPQTFITDELRRLHGDDRWDEYLEPLKSSGRFERGHADLREVLEQAPDGGTSIGVHYRKRARLDIAHAHHLEGLPGVELHGHEGTNRLVRELRESGELFLLLEAAFGPRRSP